MQGKICLEEHLSTTEYDQIWSAGGEEARNGAEYMAEVRRRLPDAALRLADMDRFGIETMILSLTSPGVQGMTEARRAIEFAHRTNELITEKFVRTYRGRFYAFANVALQEPRAAADELERAVRDLDMKGALVNGFSNIGDADTAQYLDEPPVWEFWERVAQLDVPVYLHPREPLPSQRRIYEGYPALVGSAWGFGHETGTHAVRLMLSGLFDRFPDLRIILGHLGEGLPFLLPRLQSRLYMQRRGIGLGNAQKTVGEYFRRNFYVTTSGHFHTKALLNAIAELGVEHVMFSTDYPYECAEVGTRWFDEALISDNDRVRIGRENARQMFHLP
jgi:gamma-resorcylate decarboxylase